MIEQPTRLLHYPHELTLGGGSVHTVQLLKDHQRLGFPAACATLQDGILSDELKAAGIPVFLLQREEDLYEVARDWNAEIIHGHTCGGGSYGNTVGRRLRAEGKRIIFGEHIHSVVGGCPDGDFEVAEIEGMRNLRPGIEIIPWAVVPERITPTATRKELRQQWGIPEDKYVIARHGRLDGPKLPEHFIRALAQLPDCYGILSGWGPMAQQLSELAWELGCSPRLRMLGLYTQPGNVFEAADCVVYPTHDESWCAGVIEPLLFGMPVVAYPVGGIGENLIHGQTGLHARNVDGLVRAVRAFQQYPETARKLGREGRTRLVDKGVHDPLLEAQRHLELYRRVRKEKFHEDR